MSSYRIAQGYNIALGSLVALDPQPRTVGYVFARRSFAASGAIIDEGPFVELEYSALEDATQYVSLLTQMGLLTAKTALVSVYVQDENYAWILRNGIVVKPLIGTDGRRENFWHKDFTFLVHSIRVQA